MNRLMIIGNLVADPTDGESKNGKYVSNFTVAVNRTRRDENGNSVADFFRVSAWNELGKVCQKYLSKGKKVCVIGSVDVRTYEGKDGTTHASMNVQAVDVEFLSPKDSGQTQESVTPNMTPVNMDGELPF